MSLQGARGQADSRRLAEAIDELVERHAERLAQVDGVKGIVTYGGPREELVQVGKELDLLIVGSRGYGPIGRLFHGSVSQYLAGHATARSWAAPPDHGHRNGQPEVERDL